MTVDVDVVRNARSRGMRLAVDPRSGRVRLTIPPRASLRNALAWAEEQRGWIERQQAKLPEGRPFEPGALVPLEDDEIEIVWPTTVGRTPRLDGSRLLCGGPREGLERRIERWFRTEALRILSEETAEYADKAGVRVTGVSIGDPRGRWGSCAASGAIRYSWRLILAPSFVRRATVAHEVAHRVHMNHSPAFHRVTRELFGADPGPAREWLRRHGAGLHWVGRTV
ncbi:SprT family zinc-dependent metalloprotease [Sphingomonas sp. AOB5]|uniref:M48 family metallopeptidase n=1 Tax=Sphingomonas sp. AOB5 TaxID=3034017 RepID=UPI0023F6DA98|nr:SprT family zinc-dependent metalloprotease [Sphingomonas sp. AOB5]MDF7774195.1 SprT family zinc-dependent metalloprotease [Sphingomonas sp. AOB5]